MKYIVMLAVMCLAGGCTHVEWFGGNAPAIQDEPSSIKIAEIRF